MGQRQEIRRRCVVELVNRPVDKRALKRGLLKVKDGDSKVKVEFYGADSGFFSSSKSRIRWKD